MNKEWDPLRHLAIHYPVQERQQIHMAKVVLNPMIKEMSGRMGNMVFRRSSTGQTILQRAPRVSNVKPSPAQQAHRQRFKEAAVYAKTILNEPECRAYYEAEAARLHRSPYSVAVAGYFRVIESLQN
jgi:hypothetical protein